MKRAQRCLEYLEHAKQEIHTAEHMATVTYESVNDPKFLLAILRRIGSANLWVMKAMLAKEGAIESAPKKRRSETYEELFPVWEARYAKECNKEILSYLHQTHALLKKHEESPVEFTRKGNIVLCTGEYQLDIISIESIKKSIPLAKNFIKKEELSILRLKKGDYRDE